MNTVSERRMAETLPVGVLKTLMTVSAACALLWRMSETTALVMCGILAFVGGLFGLWLSRGSVRSAWIAVMSLAVASLGFFAAMWLQKSWVGNNPFDLLLYTGVVRNGSAAFAGVMLCRAMGHRHRFFSIVEFSIWMGAVLFIFFEHRDYSINRPMFFTDPVLESGYDPVEVLRMIGVGAAFAGMLMFLGRVSLSRAALSMIILLILGWISSNFIVESTLPVSEVASDLNLSNNDEGDRSQDEEDHSDGEGNGDDKDKTGKSGGKNNSNNESGGSQPQPQPVGIAVFYDDYVPKEGIFYFRQSVLSEFNGMRLVASSEDGDVITEIPRTGEISVPFRGDENYYQKVTSEVFLLRDHPSPPALSMAKKISFIENPNPRIYVASYRTESMILHADLSRYLGKKLYDSAWTEAQKAHYLKIPDDPRYEALSDIIARRSDMRFADEPIVRAKMIKEYLEKEGFYTRKTNHLDVKDPTASFLFGSLRGYCVHFAHAAVLLLRSQGIAARVALGYAVDNNLRVGGSAVLIMSDQAHAWPEIYIDGVGWMSFDIYPERSDEPPRPFFDRDLESLFGEMARRDKTVIRPVKIGEKFSVPYKAMGTVLLILFFIVVLLAFAIKISRRISAWTTSRCLRSVFDALSARGYVRGRFETQEEFAQSLSGAIPELTDLVRLNEAQHFMPGSDNLRQAQILRKQCLNKVRRLLPAWKTMIREINPLSWLKTR